MPRQTIAGIPIDLEDGEALVSHTKGQWLTGRLGARPGVFILTNRRAIFARDHFWTDALVSLFTKKKGWILLDRPHSALRGVSAEAGMLGTTSDRLKLEPEAEARVLSFQPEAFLAQLASLGLTVA